MKLVCDRRTDTIVCEKASIKFNSKTHIITIILSLAGAIGGGRSKAADASRSVSRTIQNNFLDDKKQEVSWVERMFHT